MNKYKIIYIWWWSIFKDEKIVEAHSEEEACMKLRDYFGYKSINIIDCEQINE